MNISKMVIGVILCILLLAGCGQKSDLAESAESIIADEAAAEKAIPEIIGESEVEETTEEVTEVALPVEVIPPIPEIQPLEEIPELNVDYESEENIDVTAQIECIDTFLSQIKDRIAWIKEYGSAEDAEEETNELNVLIVEAETKKGSYEKLANYTCAELRMVAVTVAYEAGFCTDEHKEYVAQVLLNRCRDSRFDDNIYDNLVRPMQYNPLYTQKSQANFWNQKDSEAWNGCVKAAMKAMMGLVDMPENVIFQSEFKNLGTGVWKEVKAEFSGYTSITYFNYG